MESAFEQLKGHQMFRRPSSRGWPKVNAKIVLFSERRKLPLKRAAVTMQPVAG